MQDLVSELSTLLVAKGLALAIAESCTGGLLAAAMTERPGASTVFERGFVTYSNQAKTDMLDVPAALIEEKGAVSAEVAEAMAAGALKQSSADLAVAITGIAGPDGGSAERPVGLVFISVAKTNAAPGVKEYRFHGNREDIRRQAAAAALTDLIAMLKVL